MAVGAALEAPVFLTGLTEPERAHVRLKWAHARHPDSMARIATLQKVQEHLQRIGTLLSGYQRQQSDQSIVAAAKKLQSAAAAALASSA